MSISGRTIAAIVLIGIGYIVVFVATYAHRAYNVPWYQIAFFLFILTSGLASLQSGWGRAYRNQIISWLPDLFWFFLGAAVSLFTPEIRAFFGLGN